MRWMQRLSKNKMQKPILIELSLFEQGFYSRRVVKGEVRRAARISLGSLVWTSPAPQDKKEEEFINKMVEELCKIDS